MQWNATTEKYASTILAAGLLALSQVPFLAGVSTLLIAMAAGMTAATHVGSADERQAKRDAKRRSTMPPPEAFDEAAKK